MSHLIQSPGPAAPRAFTLIELLVVLSIITLLVAILLPVVESARSVAQQVQCLSNERQLGLGVQLYVNDNHNWITPAWPTYDDSEHSKTHMGQLVTYGLQASKNSYLCPADTAPTSITSSSMPNGSSTPYGLKIQGPYSYAYNAYMDGWGYGLYNGNPSYAPRVITQVRKPSLFVMFLDENVFSDFPWADTLDPVFPSLNAYDRHSGAITLALFDGHADIIEYQDVIDPSADGGQYTIIPTPDVVKPSK